PDAHAPRRDHERARPPARQRGAEPRARSREHGHDDDHRHARDELRPRGRGQGLLSRRRGDPRGGPAGADLLGTAQGADAGVPRPDHRGRAAVTRLRKAPKAPLAVAGILATPLFFVALMAMSLAVEKPTVTHIVEHGKTVAKLGDPSGTTELAIWLLAIVAPAVLVLVGAWRMLIGRAGVITSALTAVAASVVLLIPLDTWASHHIGRYPDGIDLIPPSSTSDIYLRGEWEGTARKTAEQLGFTTIALAG